MWQTTPADRSKRVFHLYILSAAGVVCNASAMVFMPLFIIDYLGFSPRLLAAYNVINCVSVLLFNHLASRWIESGRSFVVPILGPAICLLIATVFASIFHSTSAELLTTAFLFGVSASSISAFYSFASYFSQHLGLDRDGINTKIRSTTSLSWIFAPNMTFLSYPLSNTPPFSITLFPSRFYGFRSSPCISHSDSTHRLPDARPLTATRILIRQIAAGNSGSLHS